MRRDVTAQIDVDAIKRRIAQARASAGCATTSQMRQHFEGMANYWEDVLRDLK